MKKERQAAHASEDFFSTRVFITHTLPAVLLLLIVAVSTAVFKVRPGQPQFPPYGLESSDYGEGLADGLHHEEPRTVPAASLSFPRPMNSELLRDEIYDTGGIAPIYEIGPPVL
ncbi:MAG: hypothetical protein ACKVX9_19225 [Blastocatellia bacterium]